MFNILTFLPVLRSGSTGLITFDVIVSFINACKCKRKSVWSKYWAHGECTGYPGVTCLKFSPDWWSILLKKGDLGDEESGADSFI